MLKEGASRINAGVVGHAVGHALGNKEKKIIRPQGGMEYSTRLMDIAFTCYSNGLDENNRYDLIVNDPVLGSATESDTLGYSICISFIMKLLDRESPAQAYESARKECYIRFSDGARRIYYRILQGEIAVYDRTSICPSGCTADTLEAAIWCLLTTSSFEEAVKKSVKIGGGTASALTGMFAGIRYGIANVPDEWLEQISSVTPIVRTA